MNSTELTYYIASVKSLRGPTQGIVNQLESPAVTE